MSVSPSPHDHEHEEEEEEEEEDFEWEEWDGKGKFWHHCVAGSMAGVAEHTLLYPVDTVKTHIQACASCPHHPSSSSSGGSVGTLKSTHMYSTITQRSGSTTSPTTTTTTPKTTTAPKTTTTGTTKPPPSSTASTVVGSHRTLPPNSSMISTMRHIVTAHPSSSASSSSSSMELAPRTPAAAAAADTTMWPSRSSTTTTNYIRLWRGVQTMILGCIPAHAFYFSSYEITKAYFSTPTPQGDDTSSSSSSSSPQLSTTGGMAAGAAATFGHDCVMAPLDTIKQRLQLGHYSGMTQAAQHMCQLEGIGALYRSFPITLLTNVPYGMIMVSTNEYLKDYLALQNQPHHQGYPTTTTTTPLPLWTCLQASSMAGMVAAALTTPLDRLKTALQTQKLQPTCDLGKCPCPHTMLAKQPMDLPHIVHDIWTQEGLAGFYRGMVPRIVTHTPAVAISWTTYETAKQYLQTNY